MKQQIIPFTQKNLNKYKIYLKYKNNKDPKQHKLQLKGSNQKNILQQFKIKILNY